MMTLRSLSILSLATVFLLPLACSQSDFAGSARQKKETTKDGKDGKNGKDGPTEDQANSGKDGSDGKDGNGQDGLDGTDTDSLGGMDEDGDGVTDSDGPPIEDDDETLLKPQQCTTANIKFASGVTNCPKFYAAYTIDDSKSPNLGCCPLPAKDILAKEPGQPKGSCEANEIATGTSGTQLICSKINTAKYSLGPSQTTCYFGSGASGGSGASDCGAPSVTLQAMVSAFGSDACIGQPYGSLITYWKDKYCRNTKAAQLFYVKDHQPVPMNLP